MARVLLAQALASLAVVVAVAIAAQGRGVAGVWAGAAGVAAGAGLAALLAAERARRADLARGRRCLHEPRSGRPGPARLPPGAPVPVRAPRRSLGQPLAGAPPCRPTRSGRWWSWTRPTGPPAIRWACRHAVELVGVPRTAGGVMTLRVRTRAAGALSVRVDSRSQTVAVPAGSKLRTLHMQVTTGPLVRLTLRLKPKKGAATLLAFSVRRLVLVPPLAAG